MMVRKCLILGYLLYLLCLLNTWIFYKETVNFQVMVKKMDFYNINMNIQLIYRERKTE